MPNKGFLADTSLPVLWRPSPFQLLAAVGVDSVDYNGASHMTRPLVTGATGFIGKRLCKLLPSPNILTRRPETVPLQLSDSACFRWMPETEQPPPESLEGCTAVFHLAGESVAEGRWTAAKKNRIRDSRVIGTRNLVRAMGAMAEPPAVLVSSSAVGVYGTRGEEILTEEARATDGFLAEVCLAWEAEALKAAKFGTRVVTIRTGLVLGPEGGALARMVPLFRLGLGGRLGDGRHWMPWIHIADLARLFVFAAEADTLSGPVNGSAPEPARNEDFTRALGRAVGRPTFFPAPAFMLRTALGEFSDVLLASQRVVPAAALAAGFEFQYRTIDSALSSL